MSKLKLIAEKAKQDRKLKFTSLAHHINAESLGRCYKQLKKNKACGVDGVTVETYGSELATNVAVLVERIKSKKYKAHPVRRVYIPKAGKNELRPLGIPSVEDKLVQIALKEILEVLYEPLFMNCSHGFRPDRSCHTAIKELNTIIMTKPINYIVEVDIRKFFDNVDHKWLVRFLQERIVDPNLLWLICKHLKAGVMESGNWKETEAGTPQGGVISPLLANVYLHYVLDLWVELKFKPESKGYVQLVRYCDDFVVACETQYDAERFLTAVAERMAKFNLSVSQEKTRIVKFGRQALLQVRCRKGKAQTFNFLGFTFYHAKTRLGKFSVRLKTSKQSFAKKTRNTKDWLKSIRNLLPLREWWTVIKAKLTGHYNYFGVNGNMRSLQKYYWTVVMLVYKWINRRSQKKSMNFKQFMNYLQWNPLPTPSVRYDIWEFQPK